MSGILKGSEHDFRLLTLAPESTDFEMVARKLGEEEWKVLSQVTYENLMRLYLLSHYYDEECTISSNFGDVYIDYFPNQFFAIKKFFAPAARTISTVSFAELHTFFEENMKFIEQGLKDYYYYQEKKELLRQQAKKELEGV